MIKNIWFLAMGLSCVFLASCDKDQNQLGLLQSNICFVAEGGNVSNTLRVDDDWKINYEANRFITITPSSGSASETTTVNIIINCLVNNDPQPRFNSFSVEIGDESIVYTVSQDGTIVNSCIP